MCHNNDSRPPAAPDSGEVAEHGAIELTALDGNRFSAYRAIPATPNGKNVIILPDVRGLHPFYQDLAQRFAEARFHTVALDYYGRTAGISARNESFDWQPHLNQVSPDHVSTDAAAAAHALNEQNPGPTFTVGFCWGGGQSWRLSASDLDLAGVIGFYGLPGMVEDVVDDLFKPMLLLLAGEDEATTREEFRRFAAKLDDLGKDHELHMYDGAPHSFFDRSFTEWEDACTDAWRRILDFTDRNSQGRVA